jgi:phosphinothricin tripeptide acetyl hydrolase
MSVADRQALAQLFSREGNFDDVTIEDQRARFDALADLFPQTGDVYSAERTKIGGIAGEWVRTRASLADAALLYLHGGGFSIGSPKSHRHLAGALSIESGLPLFVADYRLAPEHKFPAALDDALAAYRGLIESGIAPDRLAIAGDSAGGGLTVSTLVAAREQGLPMPACAVAISPWCDLSQGGEAYRARAKRDPIVSKGSLDSLALAFLGKTDPRTPLASPLYADLKGLPPLLIQVGTEEALYDDAVALKARAEDAGVEVSAESWGGMIHVWHIFHPILSEGRDAIARAGRFLRARMS